MLLSSVRERADTDTDMIVVMTDECLHLSIITHLSASCRMQGNMLKDTKYSLLLLNQFYIYVIQCPQSRLQRSSSGWVRRVLFSHLLGLKCWVFMSCPALQRAHTHTTTWYLLQVCRWTRGWSCKSHLLRHNNSQSRQFWGISGSSSSLQCVVPPWG